MKSIAKLIITCLVLILCFILFSSSSSTEAKNSTVAETINEASQIKIIPTPEEVIEKIEKSKVYNLPKTSLEMLKTETEITQLIIDLYGRPEDCLEASQMPKPMDILKKVYTKSKANQLKKTIPEIREEYNLNPEEIAEILAIFASWSRSKIIDNVEKKWKAYWQAQQASLNKESVLSH